MSEEYVLQITYQGVDEKGRTVMLNVRGSNAAQFDEMLKHATPIIATLKPLPIKQYGGAGHPQRKTIVYLPDAPKCPKHQRVMNIREWTSPKGNVLHFWSCGEKDSEQFCREKVKPDPTSDQVIKWRELNGVETPNPAEQPKDDPTLCKIHQIKMSDISSKSGLPYHRLKLDSGDTGYCNGVTTAAASKHA